MDIFIALAKEIMVYLLLYNVVMNLVQNTSYHKYVGIFLRTLLLCMIASPILQIANIENIWNNQWEKNEYKFDKKEIETWLTTVEKTQAEIILEEYRQKIKNQIETLMIENGAEAEEVNVTLKEESAEITEIEIRLKRSQNVESKDEIKNELEERIEENKDINSMKKEIAEKYQIAEEKILIID